MVIYKKCFETLFETLFEYYFKIHFNFIYFDEYSPSNSYLIIISESLML